MNKAKIAIIGTGNIGTDLLYKVIQSDYLECLMFSGRSQESEGIKIAKKLGINTSTDSINAIINSKEKIDIVFDATSAKVHKVNSALLNKTDIFTIDLTPAKIGKLCVPVINGNDCLNEKNINLITCGGQSIIPIAFAIANSNSKINYLEMISTISSKSAGLGTRNNIDEFTQTTREAISLFTKVKKTKSIIILNPAEPPITMRTTLYALYEDEPDMNKIINNVKNIETKMQEFVPGYKVIVGPILENNRITTTIEVLGKGDFLPKYSGNLDIITCAGIEMAERYARKKLAIE